jgi:hypothetical protein
MYAQITDLPRPVQSALESVGYHRKDIRVEASPTVILGNTAYGDGYQAFTTLVNLDTGETQTVKGSWGGPNMFNPNNAVDNDQQSYTLPPYGVVIKGQRGGGKPVYATLHIPASMVDRMLPAPGPELTKEEKDALYCHDSIKGGQYRKDELRRRNVSEATISAMIERGYLKRNRAGATSITTEGKNARGDYRGW